jgi:hypothetical protein
MGWSGVPIFLSDILAGVVLRARYLVPANTRARGTIGLAESREVIWTGESEIGGIVSSGEWSIYTSSGFGQMGWMMARMAQRESSLGSYTLPAKPAGSRACPAFVMISCRCGLLYRAALVEGRDR